MTRSKMYVGASMLVTVMLVTVMLSASVAFAAPLSDSQWKKQANAYCKQVNKSAGKLQSEIFAGVGKNERPSDTQIAAFATQITPIVEQAVTSIDALEEPAALHGQVAKFKSAATEAVASIKADPTAAFTGNQDPFAKANKIAKKLGLKACH